MSRYRRLASWAALVAVVGPEPVDRPCVFLPLGTLAVPDLLPVQAGRGRPLQRQHHQGDVLILARVAVVVVVAVAVAFLRLTDDALDALINHQPDNDSYHRWHRHDGRTQSDLVPLSC